MAGLFSKHPNKSPSRERGAFVVKRAGFLEEIIVTANVAFNRSGVDVQNFVREVTDTATSGRV